MPDHISLAGGPFERTALTIVIEIGICRGTVYRPFPADTAAIAAYQGNIDAFIGEDEAIKCLTAQFFFVSSLCCCFFLTPGMLLA